MRYYISGPMRGIPHWNFEAFHECAAWLRGVGKEAISPAEHDVEVDPLCVDKPEYLTGEECAGEFEKLIGWDLIQILDPGTTGVVLIPGWERSTGARHELYVCRVVGKPVFEFVSRKDGAQRWLTPLSEADQLARQRAVANV